MALLEKKRHRGQRARKRVSREHRRTGLLVLVGLAVLVLGALAFFGVGRAIESALRADVQGVEQVEDPTGNEAPEIVADTSTKEKDAEVVAEEETAAVDEETSPEEATETEDAQLEDELAAKEATAEDEAASVPPDDPTMYLSVPKLGISGATVVGGEAGLELGGQLVGGYPWEPGSNTYIAGHRLGFPGTGSDHIFYSLPSMAPGDEVVLTDSLGQAYTYRVSEILQVDPTDLGVLGPAGRDMVSLQTCIEDFGDFASEGPNWNVRLVVRADRVA